MYRMRYISQLHEFQDQVRGRSCRDPKVGPSAIGASPPHSSFRPPMAKPVVLPAVSNCLICGIGDEPATMSQFEGVSPRGAASRAPRAFRLRVASGL